MKHFAVAVSLLACVAFAPWSQSAAQSECDSSATQARLNACAGELARRAEQRLTRLITELRAHVDSSRFTALQLTQRQWTAYRQAECKWEGDAFDDGSVMPMVVANCVAALTEARVQELKIHLCEGEGMTGDCPASRRYDDVHVKAPR